MIFNLELGPEKVAKEMAEMASLLKGRAYVVRGTLVAFPSSFIPLNLR